MEPNLSIPAIFFRYVLMTAVLILAGVFQSIPLIILGFLVFLTGITAFDPVVHLLRKRKR